MQENRGRERVGENAFDAAPRQLLFRVREARSAIHLPRRLISRAPKPFRRRAATSADSCERKTPDKIRQPSFARWRDQIGNAAIRISLNRFAVMTSNFAPSFCFKTSPVRNSMLRARFVRAFRCAVEQAGGSLSIANTRFAPKRLPAIARMPLPVPASSIVQPLSRLRVTRSSIRKHIAVVACSPVPNAASAGITIVRLSFESALRLTISREPIRSGFARDCFAKCCSQSARSFSIVPPNSRTRSHPCFFVVAISSRDRTYFGRSIIASADPNRRINSPLRFRTQSGFARFLQRYMDLSGVGLVLDHARYGFHPPIHSRAGQWLRARAPSSPRHRRQRKRHGPARARSRSGGGTAQFTRQRFGERHAAILPASGRRRLRRRRYR